MVNPRFDCALDDLPRHVAAMFRKRARLRLANIRLGGWGLAAGQLRPLLRDLAVAGAAPFLLPRLGRAAFRSVKPPLHRLVAAGAAGAPPGTSPFRGAD